MVNHMLLETIVIDRRFRGPPQSANGGYICGRLARHVEGPAQVTLRHPPPLDTELELRTAPAGGVALVHEGREIAAAIPEPLPARDWEVPSFDAAEAAAKRTFPVDRHPLPDCFVCGPQRSADDGLRLHVGPLAAGDTDWAGVLAAPWEPHENLADAAGLVRSEFVWAALDCPTAYAASSSEGLRTILLGRQTLRIERLPMAGERCVVLAQSTGQDGRKHFADAALVDAAGGVLAKCAAIWIEVSPEVQQGG